MNIVKQLPITYQDAIIKAKNIAIKIFGTELIGIVLGGSAGKNDVINGWSDIDLYIILENYNINLIRKNSVEMRKIGIHIGITYYTRKEVLYNLIDNKTKIMLYEKQYLNMNPTIYGHDIFGKITYSEIVDNDINYFPNILHVFRRMHNNVLCEISEVDKEYIKKLLVLLKCYLNINHIFSYGYGKVTKLFLNIYNSEKVSTKYYNFDIIYAISNFTNKKKEIFDFGENVLNFINEKEGSLIMNKRISSRGIIIDGDYFYAMFRRRIKDDGTVKEYYVIPGGGLEEGETLEENVIRELKEEFSVDVVINDYLGRDENEDSIANFFSVKIVNGEPKLGGEELTKCNEKNYYEIRKVSINDIDNIDIMAKDMIMKAYHSKDE